MPKASTSYNAPLRSREHSNRGSQFVRRLRQWQVAASTLLERVPRFRERAFAVKDHLRYPMLLETSLKSSNETVEKTSANYELGRASQPPLSLSLSLQSVALDSDEAKPLSLSLSLALFLSRRNSRKSAHLVPTAQRRFRSLTVKRRRLRPRNQTKTRYEGSRFC